LCLFRSQLIDTCRIKVSENLSQLKSDEFVTKTTVKSIYLLMGRELESLDRALAGNIVGLGGFSEQILKSATISSTLACPGFSESIATSHGVSAPVFRVALEPKHPRVSDFTKRHIRIFG
jgi:ribosome assembly protein 1